MNKSKTNTIKLSRLVAQMSSEVVFVYGNPETEITSVEYNSKKTGNGSLFVAVPGFLKDGHFYVRDAVSKGASAVLIHEDKVKEFADLKDEVAILSSKNTRKALSGVSAAFFGYPSSFAKVIGITGTNGKTSITYLMESIFKDAGFNPGVIGTVNYRWAKNVIEAPNTTPESRDLQEIFANMVDDGVDVIIMEASSHALKLYRVEDIEFDIAVFTNLTRDHMDFHQTFEDYFLSKRKILTLLEKSHKKNKAAVINADDEYGKKLLADKNEFSFQMLGLGLNTESDFRIKAGSVSSTLDGIRYSLEKPFSIDIRLNLLGNFQVYNSLCAFTACIKSGIPVNVLQMGLMDISSIPGRFNSIKSQAGFNVIVDYAHTDDAVSKLLSSARELNPNRVITVIGCGGNRDKSKRPIMGKTAVLNSDMVIFTSDNPRDEKPEDIIRDIIEGMSETNYEIITDREQAIKKAVFAAGKNDLVIIAGKGHENYQEFEGKRRIHFDDHELALKYIAERGNN